MKETVGEGVKVPSNGVGEGCGSEEGELGERGREK